MKHTTKQEANAARLAALKASREKRTYAKHARWAEEMKAAGWLVFSAQEAQEIPVLRDGWHR